MLCKYKDLLGKPKEGLHSIRIFNIAAVDVLLTLILAFIISRFIKITSVSLTNFWICLLLLILLSIFLHTIFCVETTITRKLGLVSSEIN